MAGPTLGTTGTKSTDYLHPLNSGTTSSFTVAAGDAVYVFIAYDASSSGANSVDSVTDSQSNSRPNYYRQIGVVKNTGNAGAPNPTIEIWAADNVRADSSLTVTVTFGAAVLYAIVAADVSGASGVSSIDVVSSGQTGGTSTSKVSSSSDPLGTVAPNDLVLACQCTVQSPGTFTPGTGFSSALSQASGSTASSDVVLNVFSAGPDAPGTYNSSLGWATASYFALLTIGIRSPLGWTELYGKPAITVSPSLTYDGSDFGGWTAVTGINGWTSGIQEAVDFVVGNPDYPIGATIVLLSSRGQFRGVSSGQKLHGFYLGPNITLTTDTKAAKTAGATQADIYCDGFFSPIAAFPNGPDTVIGTNPTNGSSDSGTCIEDLAILIESTPTPPPNMNSPATDGIHFTNRNESSLRNVLVHGASGNTAYQTYDAYGASGCGGVVLDCYDTSLSVGPPGVVELYLVTAQAGLGSATTPNGTPAAGVAGIAFHYQITTTGVNLNGDNNNGNGILVRSGKGLQVTNLHANNNVLTGFYITDDVVVSAPSPVTQMSIVNLAALGNTVADICVAPTLNGSVGNIIAGGQGDMLASALTPGGKVSVVLKAVLGITDIGPIPAAISSPAVAASNTPVSNPFATPTVVVVSGGTAITAIKHNGTTIFSQAAGSLTLPIAVLLGVGDTISVVYSSGTYSWTWANPTTPSFPASQTTGAAKGQNQLPFAVNVYVLPGAATFTNIKKGVAGKSFTNCTQIFTAGAVTFSLAPGDQCGFTYSGGTPTWVFDACW